MGTQRPLATNGPSRVGPLAHGEAIHPTAFASPGGMGPFSRGVASFAPSSNLWSGPCTPVVVSSGERRIATGPRVSGREGTESNHRLRGK